MQNEMNTLYIMLGNECNLHCRYCVQRNLVEHPIARHISPKFWNFFMSIRDNVRVVFYGGEPLLYFPAIKEIVTRRPNLSYHMPSNCKLLTNEMVDFFNKYDFHISVSWDGDTSYYTRGYDAFAENGNTIRKLKNFAIASTITKYSPLGNVFKSIHNEFPDGQRYSIVNLIMDNGLDDKSLIDINTTQLSNDVKSILKAYDDGTINDNEKDWVNRELYWAKIHAISPYEGAKCGNGRFVINVDLDGNFYNCHNLSTPSSYSKDWDKCVDRQHSKRCKTCKVFYFCFGGCPITNDKDLGRYCENARALYGPIVDWFIQKEVTGAKT